MVFQPSKDKTVYNLDVAYGIVKERLAQIDVAEQCRRSGADCTPDVAILLSYLHETYSLDVKAASAALVPPSRELSLRENILLLHYFTHATGNPLTGKQVTYRDLPGGLVYYPTFIKRTIQPLTNTFGKDAALLLHLSASLGARRLDYGDAGLVIDAFPKVPITLVLWQGDDELAGEVNLLFDSSITDYLESEDVTVVCEAITWRLVKAAGKQ